MGACVRAYARYKNVEKSLPVWSGDCQCGMVSPPVFCFVGTGVSSVWSGSLARHVRRSSERETGLSSIIESIQKWATGQAPKRQFGWCVCVCLNLHDTLV